MKSLDTLETAQQLIEKFGPNAERIAADRLDRAMEAADAQAYDEWQRIAEAIAASTRGGQSLKAIKAEPAARRSAAA